MLGMSCVDAVSVRERRKVHKKYEYRLAVIFTKVYLISISTYYNKIYVYNRYTIKKQSELQFIYIHKI